MTTFADAAGRDAYIPHQAHQDYVKVLLPHLDKLLVLDFEPQVVK
ncbi:MAG TPA: Dabb family protein [Candidatus Hydrogenedentes bacterium]|nr:Dabb family protein [Candidatus Hydrogenedentota bacterium]